MNKTTFTTDQNKLTIRRMFNAPVDIVWKAWTEPGLLDQWWAPKPWKSETKHMDFREGGYRLYAMVGPEGEKHWGRSDYEFIVKLKHFSGKDVFCDEKGKAHSGAPVASFVNQFTEVSDQTEIIVTAGYASEEDLKKVIEMGMKEGLAAAFENLDKVLKVIYN